MELPPGPLSSPGFHGPTAPLGFQGPGNEPVFPPAVPCQPLAGPDYAPSAHILACVWQQHPLSTAVRCVGHGSFGAANPRGSCGPGWPEEPRQGLPAPSADPSILLGTCRAPPEGCTGVTNHRNQPEGPAAPPSLRESPIPDTEGTQSMSSHSLLVGLRGPGEGQLTTSGRPYRPLASQCLPRRQPSPALLAHMAEWGPGLGSLPTVHRACPGAREPCRVDPRSGVCCATLCPQLLSRSPLSQRAERRPRPQSQTYHRQCPPLLVQDTPTGHLSPAITAPTSAVQEGTLRPSRVDTRSACRAVSGRRSGAFTGPSPPGTGTGSPTRPGEPFFHGESANASCYGTDPGLMAAALLRVPRSGL